MKTICSILLSLTFVCASFAQIGNKKIATKSISSVISVKPSNVNLKEVKLPRSFDVRKAAGLNVPQNKLSAPSRKSVKITTLRPYNPNLELWFEGQYSKNYFLLGGIFGGVVTYNAQRGKEYRMKVILSSKKALIQDFDSDFSNGSVSILIGNEDEWRTIPVNRNKREFSLVFSAATAGKIEIKLVGIVTPNWDMGDELWLPIKSIQVDEI